MTNDTMTRLEANTARKKEVHLMLHARELLEAASIGHADGLLLMASLVMRSKGYEELANFLQAKLEAESAAISKATAGAAA